MKLGLRAKCNLGLLALFAVAIALAAAYTQTRLMRDATQEVRRQGGLMMETAMAVRGYTTKHIKPQLDPKLVEEFLPQTVPAFAATETLAALHDHYPDYSYREAVLNPTNPRDRAQGWESTIIERYRAGQVQGEVWGIHETERGNLLYVARPIQIKNGACLACHSTAEAAPKTLLTKYGADGGFGWNLDEVVGAQVVTVPMALPIQQARTAFQTFIVVLAGIFAVMFIAVNVMLTRLVIRPIVQVSQMADRVSTGAFDVPEFPEHGSDEIADLQRAFNRMRRSLRMAMDMIEKRPTA